MLLDEIAQTSADVAATSSRLAKVTRLADCLADASPDEVPVAVAYLSGVLPQGTIGVGWAALRELPEAAQPPPTLELLEVDAAASSIAGIAGPGSQAARRDELAALFGRATQREQRFLVALLLGELRQGAQEGVMVEAVAKATAIPAAEVRRAVMVVGDLATVAATAMAEGREGLSGFGLTVLRPIQPMLAQTGDDLDRRLRPDPARRGGVEARRRPAPGAPRGRRDSRLHPEPRRHHRSRARGRGGDSRAAGRGDRPRRRGDRARRRSPPAQVPADDEPLREQGRGRGRARARCRCRPSSSTACTSTART